MPKPAELPLSISLSDYLLDRDLPRSGGTDFAGSGLDAEAVMPGVLPEAVRRGALKRQTKLSRPSRLALAAAMVLLSAGGMHAGDILRGGATLGGGGGGGGKGTAGPVNAAASLARVNARDALARTT